ncbi:hypothetical protein GCM10011500_37240 [Mucilaginibacter rubeus]|nr:hypothetical protein GCM10011500_37240 [Mucilaginibacter rubeus]
MVVTIVTVVGSVSVGNLPFWLSWYLYKDLYFGNVSFFSFVFIFGGYNPIVKNKDITTKTITRKTI